MKKSNKQALLKSLTTNGISFLKGVASGINPIIGAAVGAGEGVIKSIQKEKENNLASEVGGVGKIDYSRLLGAAVFVGLAIAFMAGYITLEDLKDLIRIFNQTQ